MTRTGDEVMVLRQPREGAGEAEPAPAGQFTGEAGPGGAPARGGGSPGRDKPRRGQGSCKGGGRGWKVANPPRSGRQIPPGKGRCGAGRTGLRDAPST